MSRNATPVHTPSHSDSSTTLHSTPPNSEGPGAAQFLSNLSEQQLKHLQFAVPTNSGPDRFSQFLETPRQTPVPKRFTFDALDAATRKQREESVGRHGRGTSRSASQSRAASKSGTHARAASRSVSHARGSSKGNAKHGRGESGSAKGDSRGRSRSATGSSTSSIDLLKVDKVKEVVEVLDWRFLVTSACVFVLNLVSAWVVTALPIALPVCIRYLY